MTQATLEKYWAMLSPNTETRCPHCKGTTQSGTHNGCAQCGRVKHTIDGHKAQAKGKQ